MNNAKPKIAVIATGGTIVSSGTSSTQMTGYSITDFKVSDLLAGVPELAQFAEVSAFSVSNIDSCSMTSAIWRALAEKIAELTPDVDGFVITHGTDTMEETGYFLNLVAKTDKPIVLTGAMRPSSAISADGPINLLNAVRVAACPESRGKGVLIVLNDRILSARDASKSDPCNAATFESVETGSLGVIAGPDIEYLRTSLKLHTTQSRFALPEGDLPRVDIVYSHTDDDSVMVNAAVAAGAKGIVHAGTGNGSIHGKTEPALVQAAANGVRVVRSSRVWRGLVVNGLERWQKAGFIPARSLPAQKARILLQLCIANSLTLEETIDAFRKY